MSRKVLLCTGVSNDNEDSKNQFEDNLIKSGYTCRVLPVLDFEFINLEELGNHLLRPECYDGLILTSPRAVAAIKRTQSPNLESWKKLPIFCIGQSTETITKNQLGLCRILGTDSGNSKNLANYILSVFEKGSKPLLLPCSNIARETIPQILLDGGLQVVKVVVYETRANNNLKDLFNDCMAENPDVIVFFSPSTVKYVMSILENQKKVFELVKIVAIGPVTEQALVDTGMRVDAVAVKPDPASLVEGISKLIFS